MPCYAPLLGYRSRERTAKGKRQIVFNPSAGYADLPVKLPCGQCIGCRMEKGRQWAIRLMHEAEQHDENTFLTLTYAPEHLPEGATLVKRHVQLFVKRMRADAQPKKGIRYYLVGEYGDQTSRPHYHALIFGHWWPDAYEVQKRGQNQVYRSNTLERQWPFGASEIGQVSLASAAYVARYAIKKVTGELADAHYLGREPEFALMSRRPGIGRGWYDRYGYEVAENGSVVVNGREQKPPSYYDDILERMDPDRYRKQKRDRKTRIDPADNTPERLETRRRCAVARYHLQHARETNNAPHAL